MYQWAGSALYLSLIYVIKLADLDFGVARTLETSLSSSVGQAPYREVKTALVQLN